MTTRIWWLNSGDNVFGNKTEKRLRIWASIADAVVVILGDFLLLEAGDELLLESGDGLLLE